MNVDIKSWHGVAAWKWKVNDDDCGICRMPFDSFCPDCKYPGDDCPPAVGVCKHFYHLHCIYKWVNAEGNSRQCPMCRRPWEFLGGGG